MEKFRDTLKRVHRYRMAKGVLNCMSSIVAMILTILIIIVFLFVY